MYFPTFGHDFGIGKWLNFDRRACPYRLPVKFLLRLRIGQVAGAPQGKLHLSSLSIETLQSSSMWTWRR